VIASGPDRYFKAEQDCHLMKMGCKTIETAAMEVFATHGWNFSNRIAL